MDVRAQSSQSPSQSYEHESESKLNDVLIFNIIKKLELKMTMEEKYEEQLIATAKLLPNMYSKYLYSYLALGYFTAALFTLLFLRYRVKKVLKFTSLFPHFMIAFTINQVERYRGVMNISPQMRSEYSIYQKNTRTIIQEKKRRVSLWELVSRARVVTADKLMEMLRFKPVY